jgi:hypothetical protein
MSYKDIVSSANPLAFWPLEDSLSSTAISDFGIYGLDGSISGNVYKNTLPLVSGLSQCLFLKDSSSKIIYPNIGSTQVSGIYQNGILWSKGKESTSFSVELFFRLNTTDNLITERVNIFCPQVPTLVYVDTDYDDILDTYLTYDAFIAAYGTYTEVAFEVSYEPFGGLYIENDKIIFATDENQDYYVEYSISDWSKRYHVVINYHPSYIEMIINGEVSVKKIHSNEFNTDFAFTHSIGSFVTQPSNNYPVSISMVSIDNKLFSIDRAQKRHYTSLETVNYQEYFSSTERVLYSPSNRETLPLFSFSNPWEQCNLNNIIQSNNSLSLPIIYDQQFRDETPTFNTISSKTGLYIGQDDFLNLSSMFAKYGSKPFIFGLSFYTQATVTSDSYILDIKNKNQGTYLSAYINSSKELVFNLNGTVIEPEPVLTTGWHDLVIVFDTFNMSIHLDGSEIESTYLPLTSYQNAIIGAKSDISDFFNSNIGWIRFSENLSNFYGHLNYNITGDKILKLNNSLKWYSKGSATYNFYIDDTLDCDGSLAYYNGKVNGITITYNGSNAWPKTGGISEITSSGITEDFYTINIAMETEDSQDNRPYLSNLGLIVYAETSKRIKANIESSQVTMFGKDNILLQNPTALLINRYNNCGATLSNGAYLKIPSIQDNTNTALVEGTSVINLFINPTLGTSSSYIFETDDTSSSYLRWSGTEFQHSGLSAIYYNGLTTYNADVSKNDWIWITAVLTNILPSNKYIYLGSTKLGTSTTPIIVGLIGLSSYTQSANDIQNEFEALTGFAKEQLVTDSTSFNLDDSSTGLGLELYNYPWQVA